MWLQPSSGFNDEDEGHLSARLILAENNSEYNRIQCYDSDDLYEQSLSPTMPMSRNSRSINFNPEVSVRFIRARSNTILSNTSDVSGSFRLSTSPIPPDTKQILRECSPVSDDEEFDRFYRTMDSSTNCFPLILPGARRLSFDCYNGSPRLRSPTGRHRSLSCDDMFFHSLTIGGSISIPS